MHGDPVLNAGTAVWTLVEGVNKGIYAVTFSQRRMQ